MNTVLYHLEFNFNDLYPLNSTEPKPSFKQIKMLKFNFLLESFLCG